ncbi:MAG TPA: DUF6356 family protein [Steroidobacter sp.]|uniref:DUF6356 family protein n=1 Tax=Steroidobacter sp. TaxID=1978227 RepID=UPI002ED84C1B
MSNIVASGGAAVHDFAIVSPARFGRLTVMNTLRANPFTEHPAAAGETYLAHLRTAAGFGFQMVTAGLACLVHALLPFLFVRTGSDCICRLHERMLARRQGPRSR